MNIEINSQQTLTHFKPKIKPIKLHTIKSGWFIVYIEGSWYTLLNIVLSLKNDYVFDFVFGFVFLDAPWLNLWFSLALTICES